MNSMCQLIIFTTNHDLIRSLSNICFSQILYRILKQQTGKFFIRHKLCDKMLSTLWNKLENDLWKGDPITRHYKWYEKVTNFIIVVGFSYGAQIASSIYSRYVITNLERRYGASSKLAGNISQAYAAGATICLIGLTLFAHKVKHKPRTTAYGRFIKIKVKKREKQKK